MSGSVNLPVAPYVTPSLALTSAGPFLWGPASNDAVWSRGLRFVLNLAGAQGRKGIIWMAISALLSTAAVSVPRFPHR